MYQHTVDDFIRLARKKIQLLREMPSAFYAGAFAGGAYVGLAVALILSVGASVPAPVQKLAMGLTFAIALILVVIAGAELFTGYTMYMTLGLLARRVNLWQAGSASAACWLGNLAGAITVAALFAGGGSNGLLSAADSLLYTVAEAKMQSPPGSLLAKSILCNWLVCLALWMSGRVTGDVAKCVVIFWCLLAFIASGYEHSVANMTLLSLAVIGRGGDLQTIHMAIYNLFFVTIGNVVGGAVFVAGLYWVADRGWTLPADAGLVQAPSSREGERSDALRPERDAQVSTGRAPES
ncbi:MAG: formate/nitrite transporter family protein [Ramlibacter sp.]|nr:formate/nitrite transporter family protein [Ramlibacter sp.]